MPHCSKNPISSFCGALFWKLSLGERDVTVAVAGAAASNTGNTAATEQTASRFTGCGLTAILPFFCFFCRCAVAPRPAESP